MNFLQVLTEDNSRSGQENKGVDGSQLELPVFHGTRPKTAPPKSTSVIREHVGLSGRIRTWSTESISETPRPLSVLSDRQVDKVRVCVRMRPFNEHEKVCPLKQV